MELRDVTVTTAFRCPRKYPQKNKAQKNRDVQNALPDSNHLSGNTLRT